MPPRTLTAYTPILPPHISLLRAPRLKPPPQNPFFHDPSHTIPTRWSLYRPLLRATHLHLDRGLALPAIRRRVGEQWRKHTSNTSIAATRKFLEKGYTLLDHLTSSSPETRIHILHLESHLAATQRQNDARVLALTKKRQPRARLQGSFLRPTIYNPPLPRLTPQPLAISMIIQKRIKSHALRIAKYRAAKETRDDMREEVNFWRRLSGAEGTGDGGSEGGWDREITTVMKTCEESFERGQRRSEGRYGREVMHRVERARKRRVRESQEKVVRRREQEEVGKGGNGSDWRGASKC